MAQFMKNPTCNTCCVRGRPVGWYNILFPTKNACAWRNL